MTHQEINKPLPRTFVNVYALDSFGRVKFYKDDYTDLIGRLDFNSSSTTGAAYAGTRTRRNW